MDAALDERAQALLDAYEAAIPTLRSPWSAKPSDLLAGRAILAAEPDLQIAVIRTALCTRNEPHPQRGWQPIHILLSQIARRHLPYAPEDARAVLRAIASEANFYRLPVLVLLGGLARSLTEPEARAACRAELEATRATVGGWYSSADQRKALQLLDDLLAGDNETP